MQQTIFSLADRVVVITGAAGLLGRRHADAVASAGGVPVLLDLRLAEVEQEAALLRKRYSVPASGWGVDITNEQEVHGNCKELVARYGHIDCLVNNAANNPKVESGDNNKFARLENFALASWQSDLAVGLTGSFLCAKHYGMAIAQNAHGGSILNISSDLGLIAPDQRLYRLPGVPEEQQPVKPVTYSVVKTGLIGLTRYLATYWAHRNVRCNAICPGGVENNQERTFLDELCSRIPLGRLASPEEYQGLLVFMLSDAAAYLNGAIISADGGRTAW